MTATSGAVDRHGGQIPPFRETIDYVKKIGAVTEVDTVETPSAGKRVVYKTVEIINGQPVARYTTERPSSGPYEVIAQ
jgi:hypothetical protein